ncbi:MAG: hypothetical protein FJ290_33530 [Planctomycetes bacterium]|nr:hypothetical protein [Planctomycetota bacterium]
MAFIPHPRWAGRLARDEDGKLKHHAVDFTALDLKEGKGIPRIGGLAWGVPFTLALRGHGDRYKAKEKAKGFELEVGSSIVFEEADQLILPTGEVWTPECGLLKTTLILDKKPPTNAWAFDLAFPAGTAFAWQPELTQQELDEGARRPDWCVGSFAVFDTAGAKIAHVPRPFARDADGAWTWATLGLAGAVLTVTVPQAFLDAARYPVAVDPTFGYTAIGGSTITYLNNRAYASAKDTPAGNGTTTSLHMYCSENGDAGQRFTLGLYADNAGSPSTLVVDTAEGDPPNGFAWVSLPTDSAASVTAGTYYWIAHNSKNASFQGKYDSATGAMKYGNAAYVAGAMPSPFPAIAGTLNYKASMYCTYTPSAAGKAPWHLFFPRST